MIDRRRGMSKICQARHTRKSTYRNRLFGHNYDQILLHLNNDQSNNNSYGRSRLPYWMCCGDRPPPCLGILTLKLMTKHRSQSAATGQGMKAMAMDRYRRDCLLLCIWLKRRRMLMKPSHNLNMKHQRCDRCWSPSVGAARIPAKSQFLNPCKQIFGPCEFHVMSRS